MRPKSLVPCTIDFILSNLTYGKPGINKTDIGFTVFRLSKASFMLAKLVN